MDVSLVGYRFDRRLRSSALTEVWTAVREHDGLPVIAKVFSIEERPGLEARVAHELELIRRLDVPGVVRALACERSGRKLYLLLEAHAGVDLAEFAGGRPLPLELFFSIACKLTSTLSEVHAQRVIHRDIKPTNVLISADGSDVVLADFGISVLLESERGHIHDPAIMRGTLPYTSPEQTGRTGREVDFRTDLYSLGVTFYELLTGQRPFVAESSLELIHAHLARQAEPPQQLRPELPAALSRLIMKLLEKAPERRYQSARGLLDDLERMRDAFARGQLSEQFELARADVPLSLQLPHQLYGRAPQRERLRAAFARAIDGGPVFAVIVGESGVGKSALLDDLAQQVIGYGGRFARGVFEIDHDKPLAGLIGALTGVAEQLLTESPDELSRWQQRLRERLGPLTETLCELAPRFVALLGHSNHSVARDPLASEGARNRVRRAAVGLLEALAEPGQPIVLALDDLQWADAATLDVLDNLSASTSLGIFVVLTARPTAIERGAALAELLAKLDARKRAAELVELGPLAREHLIALLADTLSREREAVASLADVIARKTGGNPFFVRQFLIYLSERGLLRREREGWRWELDALAQASLPEDALEMMTSKLRGLDAATLELVLVAAMIGGDIDPALLGDVLAREDVSAQLLALVDEGLLAPSSDGGFCFAHGRIREAASSLVDEVDRRRWHLQIGERLRARLDVAALEQRLFEIVEHLDRGHGLWLAQAPGAAELSATRRIELARLNHRAGHRALASGAPKAARIYSSIAASLLDAPGSKSSGDPLQRMRIDIELNLAMAEALTNEAAAADARLARLFASELSPIERGEVAVVRCKTCLLDARLDGALQVAFEGFAALGIEVPREPTTVDAMRTLPRLLWMVRPAGLRRLCELAPMTERRIEVAMELLTVVAPASYMASPELFMLLAATAAELVLAHGSHPTMAIVFGQIGLILGNALGRRKQAVEINSFCAELAAGGPLAHRVEQLRLFVLAWVEPFARLIEPADRLTEAALARGDVNSAAVAKTMAIYFACFGAAHLRLVEARIEARLRWIEQWGQTDAPGGSELADASRMLMHGSAPPPGELDPLGLLRDRRTVPDRRELDFAMANALVLAVFSRWAEVHAVLDANIERIERAMPGSWYVGSARLLAGVAWAEQARESTGAARRALLRKLATTATKLAEWTAEGGNFGHLASLLEGELSVLDRDFERANRCYESARASALEQSNPWIAALASERLGESLAAAGHSRLAIGPLLDAREHYLAWGAFAKVDQLEQRFPELARLLDRAGLTAQHTSEPSSSTSSTASKALDTASLLKAAQTLAEDLRLPDVIRRVMTIALENAGAQRAVLMLASKGQLSLAAEAGIDRTEAYLDNPPALAELGDRVPASLLHYVLRTAEPVVLASAGEDSRFASDPYFRALEGRELSALCLPMVKRGRAVGLFYFENQLSAGSIGPDRLEALHLLAGHAASALENARLYEHLRDSEIRWRSLVDQLPDFVFLIGRDGAVEYVNAAARPRQVSFSIHTREIATGGDADVVNAAIAGALREGTQARLEARIALGGETPRWYAVRVAPIAIDAVIDRAIVVATDIDDRKRTEAERDRFESQLRQQQRLDSIGTLASGVAHEINNPVQGIMNYAELIAESAAADALIREFSQEIQHETQRVATIVRHLLAFSRQELQESGEETTVLDIVEGTLSLIRAVMRRDQIQLEIDISAELPKLVCRRQQVQQVIMNLVTNARDALNARWPGYHELKSVQVSASAFERAGAAWIRIDVDDHGGGIPEAVVPHIFDPFFTTKGRDQGTGLGLAVSHGIVNDHGGRLVLDNRPGDGARFVVELPCKPSFAQG
ncbi:MAG TPA: AAA family ATPase [Enhygromyxa sp.]|nr:AAA family ATPase [Enhygromyxa sp.]